MLHRLHNTPQKYDHRFHHLSDADLEGIDVDYHGDRKITSLCHALQDDRATNRERIEKLKCNLEMAKWDGMIDEESR